MEVLPTSGPPILAPLFMVSSGQINAQLPYGVSGAVRVRVRNSAGVSREETVNVVAASPKLFTWTLDGRGQPITLHSDYTPVANALPLRPGEWAILWLTGLGVVDPPLREGHPGGDTGQYGPLNLAKADVSVLVGGKTVRPYFAGAAPGFAGLYQINFQVPADAPPGLQPIVVTAAGRASQSGVAIPVDYPSETLATRQIGAGGGTVSGGGVSLQIPPNAFRSETAIEILRITVPPPESTGRATDTYRISGIPASYSASLTLRLPVRAGVAPGDDVVAFLAPYGDQSVGEAPKGIPGTVKDGLLTVTLPALPEDGSSLPVQATKAANAPRTAIVQSGSLSHMVWAIAGLKWHTSDSGRFRIYAPEGAYNQARSVAACLDRAWTRLGSMGLETSRRKTEIPVFLYSYQSRLAKLFMEDSDNIGASESDLWGDQNVGLTINLDRLTSSANISEACITAGHELMHIVQGLYDPRGRTRRTLSHSPWLWMLEASATWFERALAGGADYVPPNVRNNFGNLLNTPLEVQPGWWDASAARSHGYAAAALLEFLDPLTQDTGGTLVANVIKLMGEKSSGYLYDSSRYSPTEALTLAHPALSSRWSTFAKNLAESKIYPNHSFPGSAWLGFQGGSNTLEFAGPDQATQTLSINMGDLSVHPVFLVFRKWNSPLDNAVPLKLKLTDPTGKAGVHLYRLAGSNFEFVQSFTGSYAYANGGQLTTNGGILFALLYQSRAVAPYTGSTSVSLSATLGEDIMAWLGQSRSVSVNVSAQVTCTGGTCGPFGPATFGGSFLGTNFSGNGQKSVGYFTPFVPDYDDRDKTPLDFTISALFNPTGTKLLQLNLTLKRKASRKSDSGTHETQDDVTLTIGGVDLSYSNYKVYDENSKVFQFKATAGGSLPASIRGTTIRRDINAKGEIVMQRTVSYTGFTVTSGNVIDIRFSR